jgi:DNA-binding PadR family transcriptional regulator
MFYLSGYLETHRDDYTAALSEFAEHKAMPSERMIDSMLSDLKKDGILKTIRSASDRRSEVLAFAQLINLAEGKKVI